MYSGYNGGSAIMDDRREKTGSTFSVYRKRFWNYFLENGRGKTPTQADVDAFLERHPEARKERHGLLAIVAQNKLCYSFHIEFGNQKFTCERTVVGSHRLRQTVRVMGLGSKIDPMEYKPQDHSSLPMTWTAKLLALSIIQNHEDVM